MGLLDKVSDILGTSASGDAINAQTGATAAANATLERMYNQQREDQTPFREAGVKALGGMQDADYMKDFSMNDFVEDPGYKFRLEEGQKALDRSAAAKGGAMSGGAIKATARYSQGVASDEFGNAYNRFNADRDRRYGRLSTLAGMGQGATNAMNAASQNYGNSVASNQVGLGNASAAAMIGDANRNASMIGQGATAAAMAFCDERLKENIEAVDPAELAEMKSFLKAYHFNYKNPKHGEGDFIGVMAQDLQKSKLGRTLVFPDHDGNLKVDLHRVLMLFLATMAEA